jgi:zinc protease
MKRLILFLFIIQGFLMAATLKQIQYKNMDLPIIYEKYNSLPIFNLQLVFTNSGAINDTKIPGITSFSAKVLKEGTKTEGSVEFARKLENEAISISAHSGFETFSIEISCLKEDYKKALKYLEEILNDPNITPKTIQKLKQLTLSKIKQKQDDFDYVASTELKKLTYNGTPLEYPKMGTLKSIEKITEKNVQKNIKKIFNLDNLIIVAGGDIEFKELSKNITPLLDSLKKQGKLQLKKISIDEKKQEKIIKKETKQSYIYFMSPYDIDVNSKDAYKAKVASFILGGSGFGSRLMEEIRVKHGLAYSAFGYINKQKSHTHFTGHLQTKIENTDKAKKMVISIIKDFVQKGVTKKELDAAKKFLTGSEPLRTETFSQRLGRAFQLYYRDLPFNYPQKELEKIELLSLGDLNQFIKKHKEIENLTFTIVTK